MDWTKAATVSVEVGRLSNDILEKLKASEFFATENACLDFKRNAVEYDAEALAELARDIGAFHNTFGGFLVFGVEEIEKDVRYKVIGIERSALNMQKVRGAVESYFGLNIEISYHEEDLNNRAIGVMFIPKRPLSRAPCSFRKRGPHLGSQKHLFEPAQVPIRRGDSTTIAKYTEDWQLVLSDRKFDSIGLDLGRIVAEKGSRTIVEHNLPSRSVICPRFVGRGGELAKLWSWLTDDFQYAKVLAGDGGKGKTSLAFEFCTQVAQFAPVGLNRIVWLTAKKKQFSGIENTWLAMPETHFDSFLSLLHALAFRCGYLDCDLDGVEELELQRMVAKEAGIQPTLFVIDDVDSLPIDDQRKVLEFALRAGASQSRFVLTTRSNATYSSSSAITLKGLEANDYKALVQVFAERYQVVVSNKAVDDLQRATAGSPLLTESIIRLLRRGVTLSKAISDWKGKSGEDARAAVLGKEIDQLSVNARRVLLCMAHLGQCSRAELLTTSGLLDIALGDALEELQNLFLIDAPTIIQEEPRFDIGVNTALLVLSRREQMAPDSVRIENDVIKFRSGVASGRLRSNNPQVGAVISQALALLRNDQGLDALRTVDAGLRRSKDHPDLLILKAELLMRDKQPKLEDARKLLSKAYEKGGRKYRLFDLWYEAERAARYGPGVIDVANKVEMEAGMLDAKWTERRAEGYVLAYLVRVSNREYDQAYRELSQAADEIWSFRHYKSPAEKTNMLELGFGIDDKLIEVLDRTTAEFKKDGLSLVRDIIDRGDNRVMILNMFARRVLDRAAELNSSQKRQTGAVERFEGHRKYLLEVVKGKSVSKEVVSLVESIEVRN